MAHPKEVRDKVRRDYVSGRQTLEVAALLNKIPLPTARMWKKTAKEQGDDWDKVRSANLLAGGGLESIGHMILAGFLVQYQSTFDSLQNDEKITPMDRTRALASLADSYAKMVNTNKKILPETQAAAVALQVVQLLLKHIADQYSDKLADFALILQTFESVVEREFS